jgi:hypothetical protein
VDCVLDCVLDCEAVGLALLLKLRVPEAVADAEPRKPSKAAPPEALGLSVWLPLPVTECDVEKELKPEAVKLVLEEKEPLAEVHCVLDCVAHCDAVRLAMLLALTLEEAVPEAEPR